MSCLRSNVAALGRSLATASSASPSALAPDDSPRTVPVWGIFLFIGAGILLALVIFFLVLRPCVRCWRERSRVLDIDAADAAPPYDTIHLDEIIDIRAPHLRSPPLRLQGRLKRLDHVSPHPASSRPSKPAVRHQRGNRRINNTLTCCSNLHQSRFQTPTLTRRLLTAILLRNDFPDARVETVELKFPIVGTYNPEAKPTRRRTKKCPRVTVEVLKRLCTRFKKPPGSMRKRELEDWLENFSQHPEDWPSQLEAGARNSHRNPRAGTKTAHLKHSAKRRLELINGTTDSGTLLPTRAPTDRSRDERSALEREELVPWATRMSKRYPYVPKSQRNVQVAPPENTAKKQIPISLQEHLQKEALHRVTTEGMLTDILTMIAQPESISGQYRPSSRPTSTMPELPSDPFGATSATASSNSTSSGLSSIPSVTGRGASPHHQNISSSPRSVSVAPCVPFVASRSVSLSTGSSTSSEVGISGGLAPSMIPAPTFPRSSSPPSHSAPPPSFSAVSRTSSTSLYQMGVLESVPPAAEANFLRSLDIFATPAVSTNGVVLPSPKRLTIPHSEIPDPPKLNFLGNGPAQLEQLVVLWSDAPGTEWYSNPSAQLWRQRLPHIQGFPIAIRHWRSLYTKIPKFEPLDKSKIWENTKDTWSNHKFVMAYWEHCSDDAQFWARFPQQPSLLQIAHALRIFRIERDSEDEARAYAEYGPSDSPTFIKQFTRPRAKLPLQKREKVAERYRELVAQKAKVEYGADFAKVGSLEGLAAWPLHETRPDADADAALEARELKDTPETDEGRAIDNDDADRKAEEGVRTDDAEVRETELGRTDDEQRADEELARETVAELFGRVEEAAELECTDEGECVDEERATKDEEAALPGPRRRKGEQTKMRKATAMQSCCRRRGTAQDNEELLGRANGLRTMKELMAREAELLARQTDAELLGRADEEDRTTDDETALPAREAVLLKQETDAELLCALLERTDEEIAELARDADEEHAHARCRAGCQRVAART
ncbi:hypothetical protein C8R43DRAFT_1140768 [Mycena crocata]|nr:hypothetical protein C8R43DRAFT_1140768 [Mycena crocata]